jgi:hypothetical protein
VRISTIMDQILPNQGGGKRRQPMGQQERRMRKGVLPIMLALAAASCAPASHRQGGFVSGATNTPCASTVDTCTCTQPSVYGPPNICYPFSPPPNSFHQFKPGLYGINRINGMPEIYGSR